MPGPTFLHPILVQSLRKGRNKATKRGTLKTFKNSFDFEIPVLTLCPKWKVARLY